ncbi:hypothetical protein [Aeromicrobium massiliense]|uniref:hypothetical protein n=1 Tax=Aeromicrobium massiliense TaxID=1464554 RepID=UPI00057891E2|nr:hypothetical protein [Aeromicrobium massiliense]
MSAWKSLALLAAVLVVGVGFLVVATPYVPGDDGDYQCAAPWDVVRHDTDSVRWGEPPVDEDGIERRCRVAARDQFDLAGRTGTAAVLVAGLSVVALARDHRARRPARRPTSSGRG